MRGLLRRGQHGSKITPDPRPGLLGDYGAAVKDHGAMDTPAKVADVLAEALVAHGHRVDRPRVVPWGVILRSRKRGHSLDIRIGTAARP